ncbi:phage tail tape measure protein, TP901 family, core region [Paenibacillus sophorae]|uniref:Phage tail tape measure protein n=1 Tax=Paenibacillus sophorae TaxID=1333845 RepID=A0A1H8H5U3_9BACL|nr:phage tail tape measure protein [Paenibacillus sophorae]QWU14447.1 phage tail tape measure protein [Paenibacillus sophorae]SEN51344.1 phage tail tape measure protein, TP901 family, core region [Paenibacillus sophorae]
MANELGILLTASLNQGASVKSVNESIKALSSHPSLQKLNVKINVDQSFVKSISSFIDATKKLNSNLEAQNRVVKETITEFKNLDGSITKTTQQILANGELIEKSRTKHDANKKAINEESKAYDEQRKTLSQLEAEMNGYIKASEKVNRNKAGQINSITNTYKNADTGKTVTVNTDSEGNVNNYSKVSNYLKAEQDALKAEQEINRQREQIAKEEYNTRKALADKNLREEEQRNKEFIAALKERYSQEQAILKNQEEMEKIHYLALQQNQKREEQYAKSVADTQQKINDARNKYGNNNHVVSSLNELESKLKSISNIGDFKSPLSSLNNDLKRTISHLDEGSHHSRSFGDSLKHAFSNIALYGGLGSVLMGVQQFFKEGISYVNELNKSLTELSIVYMQGQDEVEKYAEKFHELGMQMSITSSELAKGAVEFARQGLSQEETFSRMETAVKYAKISNLDFTTSAKILTATVNSMGISIERASDVFSYLGDATATDASEVGEAFQRVGGTAGAIGVEFEKVASWIATISSNTRESASTIGNSVKSILARMESLREKGFDEEDGTKVNDVAKALATIGVKLIDTQGNFRDFGTVMDEIGAKWSTLSNRQQAYISTATAGSYQSARFLSLMSDYQQSMDLYRGALDSAGTSTEKFGLYQQGTEAHIDKMKTALEGLWSSMFKSDGIRSVVDMLTGLFTVLDRVTKTFGGLQTIMGTATIAFLLFNRNIPNVALGVMGINLKAVALSMKIFTGSTIAARAAVIGLQAAMSLGLTVAIMGVTTLISKLVSANQKAKEEQEALAAQQKTIATNWSEQKGSIIGLIAEYQNLNEVTKGGTVFSDTEQEQKYRDLIDQISGLMPNLVASIDDKGEKHLKNADAIKQELDYTEKLTKAQQEQTVIDAGKNFDKQIDEIEDYNKQIKNLQAKMALGGSYITDGMGGATFLPFTDSELNKFKIQLLTLQSKVASSSSVMRDDLGSITKNILTINGTKIDDNVSKQIEQITKSLSLNGLTGEDLKNKAHDISKFVSDLNALKGVSADTTNYQALIAEISLIGKSLGMTDFDIQKFIDSLKESNNALTTITSHTDEVKSALNDLSKSFKDTSDTVSPLNSAIQKLRQGKSLTADEIANLIEKVDGFSSAVTTENGVLKVNLKAVTALRDKSVQSFEDMIKSKEAQIKSLRDQTNSELEQYGIQIEGIKSVAEALQALAQKKTEVSQDMSAILHDPEGNDESGQAYKNSLQEQQANMAATEESLKAIGDAQNTINELRGTGTTILNHVGESTDDANDSNNKLTDSYSDTVEVLTDLQKALISIQKLQDEEENKRNRMRRSSKEYQESLKKTLDLRKQELALLEKGAKDPSQLVSTKITTTTKTTGSDNSSSSYSGNNSSTGDYSDIINKNASANKVDANLIKAIIAQESSFNPNSTSHSGAKGLMQLMDGTARGLGVTNSYDPEQNVAGGTKYFAGLLKKYNGDAELALMAYNGGPGRIDKWLKSGKSISLPKETKEYASKVLSYYNSYSGTSSSTSDNNGVAKTTVKTGDTSTTVKTDGPTAKEIKDAAEKNAQDILKAQNDVNSAQIDILEEIKYIADNDVEEQERLIAASQKRQEKLDPTGAEFKKENDVQVNIQSKIQNIRNQESLNLQKKLKEYGIESDEYDKLIKQLQTERVDIQSDKYKKLVENINIGIDATKEGISNLDNLITQSQNKMAQYAQGTPEYNKELNYQIELKKKQKKENDDLISSLDSLIKSENLDAATKKNLKAILDELNLKDYTADIKDLNAQLIASKSIPLENKLSDLNYQLELSQAKMKGYIEGSKEYNQEIKNQISIQNEKIAVTKELIAYEETQSKNEELTAEAREEHKKRVQELTLSLYDYSDAIKSLREDYADKIIDELKKVIEQERDLKLEAIDDQIKAEDERHNARVKNIEDEQKQFEDYINAQQKSLSRQDASDDYEGDLQKKLEERQKIISRLGVLSTDNSMSAKAKRTDLNEQLASIDEEIGKFKLDRERTVRDESLQDQLDDRSEYTDKIKEIEDDLTDTVKKNLDKQKEAIEQEYDDRLNNEKYFYDLKQRLLSDDSAISKAAIAEIQTAYGIYFTTLQNHAFETTQAFNNLNDALIKMQNNLSGFPTSDYSGISSVSPPPTTPGGNSSNSPTPNSKDTSAARSAWQAYLSNKQQAELIRKDMEKSKKDKAKYTKLENDFNALKGKNDVIRSQYTWFPEGSYDELKNKDIFSAETGGMTPGWGSGGKLLLAHEKELILNKFDTSNLLKIVDVARNIITQTRNGLNNISFTPSVAGATNNTSTIGDIYIYANNKDDAESISDKVVKKLQKFKKF